MNDKPPKAYMWRPDPLRERQMRNEPYRELCRVMLAETGCEVRVEFSHITRGYRCEIAFLKRAADCYYRHFRAEGYSESGHPLGAVRRAFAKYRDPIPPRVRSLLLEALIVWLTDEIEQSRTMRERLLEIVSGKG